MKNMTKLATTATAVLMAGSVAASASIIDFTDNSTGFSGTVGGITWELTGTPIDPNTNEAGPGRPIGPLAWENDGVGIGNDEVTHGAQYLTLSFAEEVTLVGAFFLDLFSAPGATVQESALISVGSTPGAVASQTFAAGGVGGFAESGTISLTGTSFTFFAGSGPDDGDDDFALGAVQLAPVPVPAGLLLMGTALAGLGFARRRK